MVHKIVVSVVMAAMSWSESAVLQVEGLKSLLRSAVATETAAGSSGAVVVVHGGREVLAEGFGAVKGTPMGVETQFWIASVGKQFSSAAVLRAAELGMLRLDDAIANHLPAVPADKRAITLRQLLSHTSGLPQGYSSEDAASGEEAGRLILALPLAASPGSRFIYSNENFQLAACLLEVVTGEPYEVFVKRELWDRAGLQATGMARAGSPPTVAPAREPMPERLTRLRWGQQGYFSTAPDLARWYVALRDARVLSAASVAELFGPVAPIQEGAAALGWFIGKTERGAPRIFTRGNEDFGPNGLIYAYPEVNSVIVVLSHAGNNSEGVSYSRALLARLEPILDAGDRRLRPWDAGVIPRPAVPPIPYP
jgi:CubicO group peptidase (beta-lactamase class C family)